MDAHEHRWSEGDFEYHATSGCVMCRRLDGSVDHWTDVTGSTKSIAEFLRLAARVKELEGAVAARDIALNPRRWTREMSDAWNLALPDVQAAFAALAERAGGAVEELVSGERRRQIELLTKLRNAVDWKFNEGTSYPFDTPLPECLLLVLEWKLKELLDHQDFAVVSQS